MFLLFVAFLWFFQLFDTCANIIQLLHHILFMLIIYKHIFRIHIRRIAVGNLLEEATSPITETPSQNITLNLKFIGCCKFFCHEIWQKIRWRKKKLELYNTIVLIYKNPPLWCFIMVCVVGSNFVFVLGA
jgi:hypothetical protein